MAYIKYKELTKYFNFNQEIATNDLPKYVLDYVEETEEIYKAYKTFRDKSVFTDKRMILFDVNVTGTSKKIHIIPYKSISSGAILFHLNKASIFLSFDSGYQIRLNFVHLKPADKTELRKLYSKIMETVK